MCLAGSTVAWPGSIGTRIGFLVVIIEVKTLRKDCDLISTATRQPVALDQMGTYCP